MSVWNNVIIPMITMFENSFSRPQLSSIQPKMYILLLLSFETVKVELSTYIARFPSECTSVDIQMDWDIFDTKIYIYIFEIKEYIVSIINECFSFTLSDGHGFNAKLPLTVIFPFSKSWLLNEFLLNGVQIGEKPLAKLQICK